MRSKAALLAGSQGKSSAVAAPAFNLLSDIAWVSSIWASDPAQPTPADTAPVSAWRDGSNGGSWTQGTAGYQGTYATLVLDGKPAFDFDVPIFAAAKGLRASAPVTTAMPYSYVMVVRADRLQESDRNVMSLAGGGNPLVINWCTDGQYALYAGTQAKAATGSLVGQTVVLVAVFNGSSSKLRVNATTYNLNPGNQLNTNAAWNIASWNNAGADGFDGKIAFAGRYAGDITAHPKYTTMMGWFGSFYNVSTGETPVGGGGGGSAQPDTTAPTAPASVTATAPGSGEATISWTAGTDNTAVAGYRVFRDDSAIPIATTAANVLTATDASVAPGATYTYSVAAFDAAGNVSSPALASPVVIPTGRPTGLTGTAPFWNQVALSWTPPQATSISGYRIYRNGQLVATTTGTGVVYNDNNVAGGSLYQYRVVGLVSGGGVTASSDTIQVLTPPQPITGPGTGTGTRDPRYWPFTSDSPFNLPIGSGAVYEPVTAAKTAQLRGYPCTTWVNIDSFTIAVFFATSSDPYAYVDDLVHPAESRSFYIPTTATASPGADGACTVIQPDGSTAELYQLNKISNTHYTTARIEVNNIRSQGLGPQGGIRAAEVSPLGGLIRSWEVDPTHPRYTDGVIRHALAASIPKQMLYYAGDGPWGWDDQGFGLNKASYRWPASNIDSFGPWGEYTGVIPMGTYFAIPKTVNINNLGLNQWSLKVAKALQDYGGYVLDQSSSFSFYAEQELSSRPQGFYPGVYGPSYDQLAIIRAQLVVVTNSTPSTPNGGGTRPIALAPALA